MSQISVEKISNTEYKIDVSIASNEIEESILKALNDFAPKIRIDGFRKGKVPFAMVKKLYHDTALHEVIEDKVKKSYTEALEKEKLNPISEPKIDLSPYKQNEPLNYTATVEVLPTITLKDLSTITIEKLSADITEQDVDDEIETLRKGYAKWNSVTRVSAPDDVVEMSYKGKVVSTGEYINDGEEISEKVRLGNDFFIPEFEKALHGVKIGDEVTLQINFPSHYHRKDLAGYDVLFSIKVKDILELEMPSLDDEFMHRINPDIGISDLRSWLRENMQKRADEILSKKLYQDISSQLTKENSIEIPPSLIKNEAESLQRTQLEQRFKQRKTFPFLKNAFDDAMLDEEAINEVARNNVSWTLILSEVIKNLDIKLDVEKYLDTMQAMSHFFKGKNKNEDHFRQYLQTKILEEQAVEAIKSRVNLSLKTISYKEAIANQ